MDDDPRVVGEVWRSDYWHLNYLVLAWTTHDDWRGRSIKVLWEDGRTTEHCTPVGRDLRGGSIRRHVVTA